MIIVKIRIVNSIIDKFSSGSDLPTCAQTSQFTYVEIGNATAASATVGNLNQTLGGTTENDNSGNCASFGVGGDMARRAAIVTAVVAQNSEGGTGTVVTLDTSTIPFTFDSSNDTAVIDSGIFNADYSGSITDGKCPEPQTAGAGGYWEMFAHQLLNNAAGITVTDGDSLSVKWTITVG